LRSAFDPRQRVAARAFRLRPHLVPESLPALVAHKPATRLEQVAEELESLAPLSAVADARLLRVEGEAAFRDPRFDLGERRGRLGFRPAQDDEIVGVARHPAAARLHQKVERVQVDEWPRAATEPPPGAFPPSAATSPFPS